MSGPLLPDLFTTLLMCAAGAALSAMLVRRALNNANDRFKTFEKQVNDTVKRMKELDATHDAYSRLIHSMPYGGHESWGKSGYSIRFGGYERSWGDKINSNAYPSLGHHGPFANPSRGGQIRSGMMPEYHRIESDRTNVVIENPPKRQDINVGTAQIRKGVNPEYVESVVVKKPE